jgi:hypothetical protein
MAVVGGLSAGLLAGLLVGISPLPGYMIFIVAIGVGVLVKNLIGRKA